MQTNWYVITGGPSSGKTTTVNLLNARGYKTTVEHARHYLDTKRKSGKTVKEVRKHQAEFQSAILEMQIEQEKSLSLMMLFFLTGQFQMHLPITASLIFPGIKSFWKHRA